MGASCDRISLAIQCAFLLVLITQAQPTAGFENCPNSEESAEPVAAKIQFGVWDKCSVNITSYAGCIVPVKAVFYLEICHNFNYTVACDSTLDILFSVETQKNTIQHPLVTPWPNSSSTICTVSGNVTTKKKSINDVQFVAHLVRNDNFVSSLCWKNEILCCKDHIIVKDQLSSPENVSISYDGQMADISWSAPAEYDIFHSTHNIGIEGYRVCVANATSTMPLCITVDGDTTNVTLESVITPSCVQIYAIYCNEQHSKPFLSPILLIKRNTLEPNGTAVNVTVNCDGAHINWSIPEHLQGYHIYNYSVYINELNMMIETYSNSIDIILNGSAFSFNQLYTGEIRANVCGGISHIHNFTLHTSIPAPLMSKDIHYNVAIINATYILTSLKAKVTNITCTIGFPTQVALSSLCTSYESDDNHTVTMKRLDKEPVDIHLTDEGEALLVYELPRNQTCNVMVYFTTDRSLPDKFQYTITIKTSYPEYFEALPVYSTITKLTTEVNSSCLLGCCSCHSGVVNDMMASSTSNSCQYDHNYQNDSNFLNYDETISVFKDDTTMINCNSSFLVCYHFKATHVEQTQLEPCTCAKIPISTVPNMPFTSSSPAENSESRGWTTACTAVTVTVGALAIIILFIVLVLVAVVFLSIKICKLKNMKTTYHLTRIPCTVEFHKKRQLNIQITEKFPTSHSIGGDTAGTEAPDSCWMNIPIAETTPYMLYIFILKCPDQSNFSWLVNFIVGLRDDEQLDKYVDLQGRFKNFDIAHFDSFPFDFSDSCSKSESTAEGIIEFHPHDHHDDYNKQKKITVTSHCCITKQEIDNWYHSRIFGPGKIDFDIMPGPAICRVYEVILKELCSTMNEKVAIHFKGINSQKRQLNILELHLQDNELKAQLI